MLPRTSPKRRSSCNAARDALEHGNYSGATGNAVHAGIAVADAIAAARSGTVRRGPHDQAAIHLERAGVDAPARCVVARLTILLWVSGGGESSLHNAWLPAHPAVRPARQFPVMPAGPRFPTDHEPRIEVRPAVGRSTTSRPSSARTTRCARLLVHGLPRQPRARRRAAGSHAYGVRRRAWPGRAGLLGPHRGGLGSIAPRASYRRLLNSRTLPVLDDRDVWIAVVSLSVPGTASTD